MANYLRNRSTAERLIRNNGTITQMTKTNENIDQVTGKPVGPAELSQDITIVFLPPGSDDGSMDQFKDDQGVLDLSRLKKVLISTEKLQWDPEQGCLVLYDGEWWNYYATSKLDPDGKTTIFFKGFIRRV